MKDPSSNEEIDPSSNQKIDPSYNEDQKLDFIKVLAQEEGVRQKIAENMFWQHSHNTTTKPVCHYCIDLSNVKIRKIPSNLKEQAYMLYKQTEEGKKYTVVDVDPDFWGEMFFKKLSEGLEECEQTGKSSIVKIPNGCCSHPGCPISLFYRALTIYCYQFNVNLNKEVGDEEVGDEEVGDEEDGDEEDGDEEDDEEVGDEEDDEEVLISI